MHTAFAGDQLTEPESERMQFKVESSMVDQYGTDKKSRLDWNSNLCRCACYSISVSN